MIGHIAIKRVISGGMRSRNRPQRILQLIQTRNSLLLILPVAHNETSQKAPFVYALTANTIVFIIADLIQQLLKTCSCNRLAHNVVSTIIELVLQSFYHRSQDPIQGVDNAING